jgi:amino acid transporter
MSSLVGPVGASFVSIVVAISTFGAVNSDLLGAPRLFYAAAEDGLFFRTLGRVHPTYRTPYVAIVFSAVLGVVFVLTGTFEQLADTFVLAIWPFYALGVAAIYRLRRSRPEMARPYRAIGYPLVPALFVLAVAAFVVNSLLNDTTNSVITFALIFAGVPIFYAFFS